MADIFYKPVNRRDFIKIGLGAAATALMPAASRGLSSRKPLPGAVRLAFMADTHVPEVADNSNPPTGHYCYNPRGNLQKAVSQIVSENPDGVVIAGDLARLEGKRGDYTLLKELLNPLAEKTPLFTALGNHDHRKNFYEVFDSFCGQKQSVKNKHVVVFDKPPVRVIVLDSLLYVNKVAGLLGKDHRQWLKQYLQNSDSTPTLLCLHHTLGDGDDGLLDSDRFLRIIKPFRKVKAVIHGHCHNWGFYKIDDIAIINVPAIGYTFREDIPVGWMQAELTAKGGNFTLRFIDGNMKENGSVKRLRWRS